MRPFFGEASTLGRGKNFRSGRSSLLIVTFCLNSHSRHLIDNDCRESVVHSNSSAMWMFMGDDNYQYYYSSTVKDHANGCPGIYHTIPTWWRQSGATTMENILETVMGCIYFICERKTSPLNGVSLWIKEAGEKTLSVASLTLREPSLISRHSSTWLFHWWHTPSSSTGLPRMSLLFFLNDQIEWEQWH